jgi:hypothetical protein
MGSSQVILSFEPCEIDFLSAILECTETALDVLWNVRAAVLRSQYIQENIWWLSNSSHTAFPMADPLAAIEGLL